MAHSEDAEEDEDDGCHPMDLPLLLRRSSARGWKEGWRLRVLCHKAGDTTHPTFGWITTASKDVFETTTVYTTLLKNTFREYNAGHESRECRVLALFLFFTVRCEILALHIAIIASSYFSYAENRASEKRDENVKGIFIEFFQGKVFRYYRSLSKEFVKTLRVSYRKSVGYIT